MPVTGFYLAKLIRTSAAPYLRAYVKCILLEVLPVFDNLEYKADELAEAEYERLTSEPSTQDITIDMCSLADSAVEKGQDFFDTRGDLRQANINLCTVGLFHLLEHQLTYICTDRSMIVPPVGDTKLSVLVQWYRKHLGLDLEALTSWEMVDELRTAANTVKHAEIAQTDSLRKRRPEFFKEPLVSEIRLLSLGAASPIRLPLAGDLFVSEGAFREYTEVVNRFLEEIAGHFDVHGIERYPRCG